TVKAGRPQANGAGSTWTVSGTGKASTLLDVQGGTTRVLGTTGPLAVVGVGGTSAVVVGAGTLGPVVGGVAGGSAGGAASLTLDDSSAARNAGFLVTNHAVRFNNQLPITYAGTQSLTVKGGRGASTFDVWSTTAATPVFLDAGPGSNAFIVGVP